MKTKLDAVLALLREAHSQRLSKTALARVRSACRLLGLTDAETQGVESWLDYRDSDGEIYPRYR